MHGWVVCSWVSGMCKLMGSTCAWVGSMGSSSMRVYVCVCALLLNAHSGELLSQLCYWWECWHIVMYFWLVVAV